MAVLYWYEHVERETRLLPLEPGFPRPDGAHEFKSLKKEAFCAHTVG